MTKDIKALLNNKKRAFRAGNRDEARTVQVLLKGKIRELWHEDNHWIQAIQQQRSWGQ